MHMRHFIPTHICIYPISSPRPCRLDPGQAAPLVRKALTGKLPGVRLVALELLAELDPAASVREMMLTDIEPIPAYLPDDEVASLFERNDWVSAPVVDDNGKLLGRITIDDVVDVIREDADHTLMSMAGLDEDEDTFAPVSRTAPRRAVWLGINLATAFIAAGPGLEKRGNLGRVKMVSIGPTIAAYLGIAEPGFAAAEGEDIIDLGIEP